MPRLNAAAARQRSQARANAERGQYYIEEAIPLQIDRCESDLKPGDKVVMIGGDGTQYTVAGTPYYMRWLDQWQVWLK